MSWSIYAKNAKYIYNQRDNDNYRMPPKARVGKRKLKTAENTLDDEPAKLSKKQCDDTVQGTKTSNTDRNEVANKENVADNCGSIVKSADSSDLKKDNKLRELVLEVNKMQMPEDFYQFFEFCKSINPSDPKSNLLLLLVIYDFCRRSNIYTFFIYYLDALCLIGIELVGIYDLLLSDAKLNYKLHSRFFYVIKSSPNRIVKFQVTSLTIHTFMKDPPEFQTVLNFTLDDSLLHFGYFRYKTKHKYTI